MKSSPLFPIGEKKQILPNKIPGMSKREKNKNLNASHQH
jgi:hypothetical protein